MYFWLMKKNHLWKYNFTEAHYLILAGPSSPKESPVVAYAASAAPVSTPMVTSRYSERYYIFYDSTRYLLRSRCNND